jgi:hypothetical protein
MRLGEYRAYLIKLIDFFFGMSSLASSAILLACSSRSFISSRLSPEGRERERERENI